MAVKTRPCRSVVRSREVVNMLHRDNTFPHYFETSIQTGCLAPEGGGSGPALWTAGRMTALGS